MNRLALILVTVISLLVNGCAELVYIHGHEHNEVPQIYRMQSDGSDQQNISTTEFDCGAADVSSKGNTLAFTSHNIPAGGTVNVYLMPVDGGERSQLTSGAFQKRFPRWGLNEFDREIVLVHSTSSGISRLYLVNQDGYMRQLTNPGPGVSDIGADIYYSRSNREYRVVFARQNMATGKSDLFTIRADGTGDLQRITNTDSVNEKQPVVSHKGEWLAYRAHWFTEKDIGDVVRIMTVDDWNPVHEITMQPPAQINIRGIGWSRSDRRVYVSIEASDVEVPYTEERAEIFSVKRDGSDQKRLTNNLTVDYWPNGIPCQHWRWICAIADFFSGD